MADLAGISRVTPDNLWQCGQLTLKGQSRPRLDRIDLAIPRGITAILGPSGSGKTSLLNLLARYESPSSGSLHVAPHHDKTRPALFWSPADHGLWPHLTVAEHFTAVGSHTGQDWLQRLELSHLSSAHPATLSLGERSRLSVGRALASDAAVLVLDEPLAHVDGPQTHRCWSEIRRTVVERPMSLVFSTHDPQVALREADWCLLLSEGRCLAAGKPWELYHNPATREIAERLGAITWLTAEEWALWFEQAPLPPSAFPGGVRIRPHELGLEQISAGPIVVDHAAFVGSREEVVLRHLPTGQLLETAYQPARPTLRPGDAVRLFWLATWLCLLTLPGCIESATGPLLTVVEETYWTPPPEGLKIPAPRAVTAASDGTVYALDNAGRILVFDADGQTETSWFMPEYSVGKPERLLVTRSGELVIADTHYHRVVIFDRAGKLLRMFGRKGEAPGEFIYPVAVAEDERANLYVCEYGGHDRVQIFRPDGTYVSEFGRFGTGTGQFQRPSGIVWHDGLLYIADAFNNRIHVVNEHGQPAPISPQAFAADLHYPYDIARGPTGDFFVVEYGAGRVTQFTPAGDLVGRYGQTGTEIGMFSTPWGLSVTPAGKVLVADTGNRRIVELTMGD